MAGPWRAPRNTPHTNGPSGCAWVAGCLRVGVPRLLGAAFRELVLPAQFCCDPKTALTIKAILKKGRVKSVTVHKCKKTVLKKTNTTFLPQKNEIVFKKKGFQRLSSPQLPPPQPTGPPLAAHPPPQLHRGQKQTQGVLARVRAAGVQGRRGAGPSGRGLCEGAVRPDASESRGGT